MLIGRLFKSFDRKKCEREVEEELRFHLELLTDEHLRSDASPVQARAAALERFGNVEQVKEECVDISRRSNLSVRVLKSLLVLVFLAGVLMRVFSRQLQVMHVGDILIAIALMSRLFLYVRGLNPSSFRPKPETSSPLRLIETGQTSISPYDHRKLTPVERVIADK